MLIRLHHYPGNASLAPHILLCELGVPFELALVDRTRQAHKQAAYLKLNPNGLIPVLEMGDAEGDGAERLVLYETVAILMHLADTHPKAQMLPPLGSSERAHTMKWLVWLTNTVQTTMFDYFYPDAILGPDHAAAAPVVKAKAQRRMHALLAQLDEQLATSGGPWLVGGTYTAADPLAFLMGRWTRSFTGTACAPAREWPHLGPYLQRMLARPAVQRACAAEGLPAPLV